MTSAWLSLHGWPVIVVLVVVLGALAALRVFMMGVRNDRPLGSEARKRDGIWSRRS